MPRENWPHFRFFALTNEGRINKPSSACHLPDDTAAVRHAKIIVEDDVIEIWQGGRVVARIIPDDA
jgi:hypothetical protein